MKTCANVPDFSLTDDIKEVGCGIVIRDRPLEIRNVRAIREGKGEAETDRERERLCAVVGRSSRSFE